MEELDKDQIAELESLRAENERLKQIKSRNKSVELLAENETLRARLAELEKQEPVAWEITVGKWIGGDRYINDTALSKYHRPGAKPLYAAPVVSHDVENLKAKPAENYFELACHEYRQQIQSLKAELEKLIADHNADMAACHEQFMEVSREVMSLKAELEAARKDAERLDWLLAHSDATVCSEGVYGPFHIWFRYSNRTTDEALTARAAIDAAIEQAKGGV